MIVFLKKTNESKRRGKWDWALTLSIQKYRKPERNISSVTLEVNISRECFSFPLSVAVCGARDSFEFAIKKIRRFQT